MFEAPTTSDNLWYLLQSYWLSILFVRLENLLVVNHYGIKVSNLEDILGEEKKLAGREGESQ